MINKKAIVFYHKNLFRYPIHHPPTLPTLPPAPNELVQFHVYTLEASNKHNESLGCTCSKW